MTKEAGQKGGGGCWLLEKGLEAVAVKMKGGVSSLCNAWMCVFVAMLMGMCVALFTGVCVAVSIGVGIAASMAVGIAALNRLQKNPYILL